MSSEASIEVWLDEMSSLVPRFVAEFAARHGYPPGEHYVTRSTDRSSRDALAAILCDRSARNLIEFYSYVACVSLPDVGPGFFIQEAEEVVSGLRGAQPTCVSGPPDTPIVVFGSDGGGALFAIDRRTGAVIRLAGGSLLGAAYEVGKSELQVMARGFLEFLRSLRDGLE
ncbi:hypothetical protein ACH4C2_05895 [Streptomyces sp. NPDC018057]|uniref:hypothetical protein n=1 Tax=unclassified Streptomyces TaxID=2593676 RepID=UPI0037A92405